MTIEKNIGKENTGIQLNIIEFGLDIIGLLQRIYVPLSRPELLFQDNKY